MADPWAEFRDAPSSAPATPGVQRITVNPAPQGDPWADFRESETTQQAAPKTVYRGSILPFSKNDKGEVSFDSDAGVVGMAKRFFTLPHDVATGDVVLTSKNGLPGTVPIEDQQVTMEPNAISRFFGADPNKRWQGADPEGGIARTFEAATLANPATVGMRVAAPVATPSIRAAQTAVDLGAPLPKGIATENMGVQAVTQAARQMPYVGQRIDQRLANTATAADERLAADASTMRAGIDGRANVGESLRAPIHSTIAKNKADIDAAYGDLRAVVDTQAPIYPSNLKETLTQIAKERFDAGWEDPRAGMEKLINLVKRGAGFDHLQRARTELAEKIDFANPHGGFTGADQKRIYAAISADMEHAVRNNIAPQLGANATAASEYAVGLLQNANKTAERLIGENRKLSEVVGSNRDELLAGRIVAAANGRTGDVKLLAQLKSGLPKADFDRISGTILGELGRTDATGFSLAKFSTSWNQLGSRQKDLLFGKQRQFYDDVANLASFVKGTDQFKNTSGTARANAINIIFSTLAATGGAAYSTGSVVPLVAGVAGLASAAALAKVLASPAGAASIARMSRAAQAYTKAPNSATRASLVLASRGALRTIEGLGADGPALMQWLQSPMKAPAEPDQN